MININATMRLALLTIGFVLLGTIVPQDGNAITKNDCEYVADRTVRILMKKSEFNELQKSISPYLFKYTQSDEYNQVIVKCMSHWSQNKFNCYLNATSESDLNECKKIYGSMANN